MNEIILSMIFPAYNVGKYIEECIETCERQDIPRECYEIIVVNDGSTDDTLDKVRACSVKFSNIKIINQHNQGVSVARNNGLKEARGKYIWFVDPDDEVSVNCLSSLISIMDKLSLQALVVGPQKSFIADFPITMEPEEYVSGVCSGVEYLLDETNYAVAPWCFIFLHSFWKDYKFSFIPGIRYEDTELMPYVTSKVSRIAKLTMFSCYKYIQHEEGCMRSCISKNKIKSIAVVINSHMRYANETNVKDLCLWFKKSASSLFIDGLKKISQFDGDKYSIYHEFLNMIQERPLTLYGKNVFEKVYQCLFLYFPKLYLRIIKKK